MYIVLLETSGNQRYIFSTNKLRENVGASELTYQIGTRIVVEEVGRPYNYSTDNDGSNLRKLLLDEKPIEDPTNKNDVEIIIATSGKAMLLTKCPEKAKEIVGKITKRALVEMPGLTVHGAICEVKADLTDIHNAVGNVHRRLEDVRYNFPSNEQRFQRLPFFAECASSHLPASNIKTYKEENEPKLFSSLSFTKRETRNAGYKRIREAISGFNFIYPERIEECDWTAIIHADGNGLGQVFLSFDKYAGFTDKVNKQNWTARQYINDYREFSIALDICTIKATKTALIKLKIEYDEKHKSELTQLIKDYKRKFSLSRNKKYNGHLEESKKYFKQARSLVHKARMLKKLPVVPLVLGGDDLTVLCDGKYALKFAHDFLKAFEAETATSEIVRQIAQNAFQTDYLGICAGIAIIKPHYPFHQAYKLAEQLLKSAKKVKTEIKQKDKSDKDIQLPSSAIDFHILYDSAHSDLEEIRKKLSVKKLSDKKYETRIFAKPYIVTDGAKLNTATDKTWFEQRLFGELEKRVCVMREKVEDENRMLLPTSKMNEIRQSLFLGKDAAEAETNLVNNRLDSEKAKEEFEKLLVDGKIFFSEAGENFTHFLDALDALEFWEGFECNQQTDNAEVKDGK